MPICVDTTTLKEMMKHHPNVLVQNVARELLGLRKYMASATVATREPITQVNWVILREFSPAVILPLASYKRHDLPDYQEFEVWPGEIVRVRMTSKRYVLFAKNPCCVRCGLRGTVMALEHAFRQRGKRPAHFNLYAVKDGRYVLMTKDHIVPTSRGGLDHMANLQTMCGPCNFSKGAN
jgi:hypothetical protein